MFQMLDSVYETLQQLNANNNQTLTLKRKLWLTAPNNVHFTMPSRNWLSSWWMESSDHRVLTPCSNLTKVGYSVIQLCMGYLLTATKIILFRVFQCSRGWMMMICSVLFSSGTVRDVCCSPDGRWIAFGFSTGLASVLDIRGGLLRSQRRAHTGDIFQV